MTSAAELLEAGVKALARADAAQLERLAAAAESAPPPATREDRRAALQQHRTLGHLLRLTRHNLRVLRGGSRGVQAGRS